MHSNSSNVFQNAWIVDDIEATAVQWASAAGVGPFFITEYQQGDLQETMYRGEAAPITAKVAIAQAGQLQIELIQPTGSGPNVYRDTVAVGKTGFHHIAMWSQDLNADVNHYIEQGFEVAAKGKVAEVGFVYIDTSDVLGHMIELVEDKQIVKDIFQLVSDAAKNWDGNDPVRPFNQSPE